MIVITEDQILFYNFIGDLTFCDAETVKELDKIGKEIKIEIKETQIKKAINEKERAYNLEYNELYKNKNNQQKELLYLKRLLPIRYSNDLGTKIESKFIDISDDIKKILFTPSYIPKNYRYILNLAYFYYISI